MDKHHRSLAQDLNIRPKGSIDDRVIDLAQHSKRLTERQIAEAEAAALRGGKG